MPKCPGDEVEKCEGKLGVFINNLTYKEKEENFANRILSEIW